ncbi:hypothetical protein IFM89_024572 [Coptis chinensis]|uniref:Mediator of RNA polymerase II transcription subunit 9 n=1 Tax=Coptis chinensis TaxID=261450 RepID=A0A835I6T2_9MAGN|nr:hypothetical protein IFM89_024572 [Coptis chinensis]
MSNKGVWLVICLFFQCAFPGKLSLLTLHLTLLGARFGFVLDKELKEAASSDEVKAAIADKISRERIGHEIDLMISGNEPVKAMAYICELQLFWVVFSLPCLPHESGSPNFEDRLCVAYVDAAWSLLQVVGYSTFNDDQRRLYLYGVLFLPLRKSMYSDNKGKKAIKVPVVNHIFRNSLKLKASDAETVINLHVASERFVSLVPFLTSKVMNVEEDSEIENFNVPDTSKQRIVAGKLLREIKGFWRVSLLISTLIFPSDSSLAEGSSEMCAELDKSSQMYRRVENIILELGLDNVWEMKPLVNGKEIMSILQLKTGGPQVKEWKLKRAKKENGEPIFRRKLDDDTKYTNSQQHSHTLILKSRSLLTHLQQQQQLLQQQRLLQQQQQQQHHQSLASHFHLLHLVENLADVIENGTRDQHTDVLINELTSNFDKCQQLLNSISGSISSKAVTVEGQKRKFEESEQLLNQRRELIAKYRSSVDELVKEDR